jgi:hypothetical protein
VPAVKPHDGADSSTGDHGSSEGLKIESVRGIVRTLSTVLSQAVEDEHLSANPALSMRKYLRRGDQPETPMDPFTRDEVADVVETARGHFPT